LAIAGKEETGENIQETFADAAFSCGDWRDGLFALLAARRARHPSLSAATAHRGIPTQAVIDGRGSGLTLLALTKPLIRFGRALGHHAPGWQVIVEPQLVRFTSLATGRMRVTTDDPVDRGPISPPKRCRNCWICPVARRRRPRSLRVSPNACLAARRRRRNR
jgi:hypothetical protein